jgi:uncharacterized protein YecE (DUF72 family)
LSSFPREQACTAVSFQDNIDIEIVQIIICMKNTIKDSVHIGTSSFSSKDWIGTFYPEGAKPAEFLKIYSKTFDSVEIDSTYYSIPSIKTVESWVTRVPENFKICAKFPRSIVHAGKDSRPDARRVLNRELTYGDRDKFLEVMAGLKEKAGPLLIQFPYFSKDVFSFREVFFEILDKFLEDLPGDFRYIRLLGDRKAIEAVTKTWAKEVVDNTERLKRWASVLQRLADRAIESYVFANNHYSGHAPATARRLRDMVFDDAY